MEAEMGNSQRTSSGRWQAIARVNGARISCGVHDSEWEADAAWQDREADADREQRQRKADGLTPLGVPFRRAAADYMKRASGRCTYATMRGYDGHVRFLETDPLGSMLTGEITKHDVQHAIARWRKAEYGAPTIRARFRVLRFVLRDAGNMAACVGVKLPATAEDTGVYLTDRQASALLVSGRDAGWYAFLLAALDAGLRWAEVAGLTVENVDLASKRLHVRAVVERNGNLRRFTKGHRARTVPLTAALTTALKPLVAAARLRGDKDGLLFPNEDGGTLGYDNYKNRVWPKIRGKADGMRSSGVTFHDLRTTFGSRLAARGVPETEIGKLLGHAPGSKATQVYIRLAGHTTTDAWLRYALDGGASPLTGAATS